MDEVGEFAMTAVGTLRQFAALQWGVCAVKGRPSVAGKPSSRQPVTRGGPATDPTNVFVQTRQSFELVQADRVRTVKASSKRKAVARF